MATNDLKFSIVIDTKTGEASLKQLDSTINNTANVSKNASKTIETGWVNAFAKISVIKDIFSGLRDALTGIMGSSLEYEQSLKNVASLSDDVVNNYDQINRTLKSYSTQIPVKSTKELADAMYQAVSAGYKWEDALKLVEQAGKGSVAGLATVPESMNALISVMNAFGYTGKDTAMVMDRLFQTVRKGVTTFPEIASSMSQVAPVAAMVGIKFEDLMASMVTLTKMKIPLSEAVTKMARVIPELTRNLGEGYVQSHSLQESLQALYERAGGNLNRIKEMVGSKEAADAVIVIGKYAKQANQDLLDMQNSTGAAQKAFEINASSTANAIQLLKNNIAMIKSSLTSVLLPVVKTISEGLLSLVNSFAQLPKPFQAVVVGLVSLKGAFMLLNVSGITPLLAPLTKISGSLLISLASNFKIVETAVMSSQRAFNIFSGVLSVSIVGAITALIMYLPKLNEALYKMSGLISDIEIENLSNGLNEALNKYQEFEDKTGKVVDRLIELSKQTNKTTEEQQEYNRLLNEVAKIYPSVVEGIDNEGNAIINLNDLIVVNTNARGKMIAKLQEQTNALSEAAKKQWSIVKGEIGLAGELSSVLNKMTFGLLGKSEVEQMAQAKQNVTKLLDERLKIYEQELKLRKNEIDLFTEIKKFENEFGEALTMSDRNRIINMIKSHNMNISLLNAQNKEANQTQNSLEVALKEVKRLQKLWIEGKTDEEALVQFNTRAKQFFTRYRRFKADIVKEAEKEGVDKEFLKVLLRGVSLDKSGTKKVVDKTNDDRLEIVNTLYETNKITFDQYLERTNKLYDEIINSAKYKELSEKFTKGLLTPIEEKEYVSKLKEISKITEAQEKYSKEIGDKNYEAYEKMQEERKKRTEVSTNELKNYLLKSRGELDKAIGLYFNQQISGKEFINSLDDYINQIKENLSNGNKDIENILNEIQWGNLTEYELNELRKSLESINPVIASNFDSIVNIFDIYNKEMAKLQNENIEGWGFWSNQIATILQTASEGLGMAIMSGFSKESFLKFKDLIKEGFKTVLIAIADALDKMYIGANLATLIEWIINPAIGIVNTGKLLAAKLGIEAFKGMVKAFATGGIISQPTLALMGESGTEVVAPKQDFITFARELIAMERKNIPRIYNSSVVKVELEPVILKQRGRDLVGVIKQQNQIDDLRKF